jgi:phosphatidate cytidylyltransferase
VTAEWLAREPAEALRRARGRRLLIGLALAIGGLGSVFYAPTFDLVVMLVAVGSLWEFAQLSARKGTEIDYPVALIAVLAYLALTAFGLIHRWEGVLLAATVIAALAGGVRGAFNGSYLSRAGYTLLGVLYIGKLLTYFIAIRAVPHLGIPLTLYVIILVGMTDVFCMVVGVLAGRTPLSRISPRKTVEGALGGFAVATLCGLAFAVTPALHFAWWQGVVIGAVTSAAAQAGDLVESALKRDARVKDAGSAVGAHGGVLDRFDSYLFGGVAFYFALFVIGIVPVR